MNKIAGFVLTFVVLCAIWSGVTYNSLITKQENVSMAWSQVEATYQRRLDLIPNLVATVKGYAKHENATLTAVINARAAAFNSLGRVNPDNAEQMKEFNEVQANLTSALRGIHVVVESYPNLKANENFLSLQSQLEGTENRITVARERFNETAQDYNATVRRFPANLIAQFTGGFGTKSYFAAQAEAKEAPKVSFE